MQQLIKSVALKGSRSLGSLYWFGMSRGHTHQVSQLVLMLNCAIVLHKSEKSRIWLSPFMNTVPGSGWTANAHDTLQVLLPTFVDILYNPLFSAFLGNSSKEVLNSRSFICLFVFRRITQILLAR